MALIDRESLKANIIKMLGISGEEYLLPAERAIWDVINEEPPVQPKCGHWMIEPTEEPEYCKCSECGYVNLIVEVFSLDGYHYCPNCGAKMERNEDGTDL
jgi:hypothetical protein